jgi:hypothetical protein
MIGTDGWQDLPVIAGDPAVYQHMIKPEQRRVSGEGFAAHRGAVADAHMGAGIQSASADQITVVTSDPGDMRRVAGDRSITIAAI